HLDVACGQIPVSCVLTSASVHDSQVAIPLMTITGARVSYLYDLMDAAYDAAAIHDHSKALGHAPIIDRNYRAQHEAKAEWAKEVERMKLIHMPDPDDRLFDFRTMAERVNARLKDEFGARVVRVRGAIKVKCHLMFGVVALAVDQILRLQVAALQDGHDLLERKRELLTRLVHQRLRNYRELRKKVGEALQGAYHWLSIAQMRMG